MSTCVFLLFCVAFLPDSAQPWNARPPSQCTRQDVPFPPLVVISMDGFAARYLDLGVTPNINAFGQSGVKAQHIYSTFPSRTFVNHYAMATGLWAESHGIVDNNIWDRTLSDNVTDISHGNVSAYYLGEPIWSAYKRILNGKTACLFWAGCSQKVNDYMPDLNPEYNESWTTEQRIDQVLEWVNLDEASRPNLIMAYISQPDHTGHFKKNEAEVTATVKENDDAINQLLTNLDQTGMLDCVNILLVSDHGMTNVTTHIYWDDYLSFDGILPVYGVIGRIYLNSSERSFDDVTEKFTCSNGSLYSVHDRASLPARYHYASTPRVGDVIFEGRPGTTFYAKKADDWFLSGDHGYDPTDPNMRTVFFARGPSIRSGLTLQPFHSVNYFHIYERLLGMPEGLVPTNGTIGIVDEMFTKAPLRKFSFSYIPSCPSINRIQACTPQCTRSQMLSIANSISQCQPSSSSNYPITALPDRGDDYCTTKLCDFEVIRSNDGESVVISEMVTADSLRAASSCYYEDVSLPCHSQFNSSFQMASIAAKKDAVDSLARVRVPLFKGFIEDFLSPLNSLLAQYISYYGRVHVISGTIFDNDHNGLEDVPKQGIPTHIFRILITCPAWRSDGLGCTDAMQTKVIAFILPHMQMDRNCLPPDSLLFSYTARVQDVSSLTSLLFFSDPSIVPPDVAIKLRNFVPLSLWP